MTISNSHNCVVSSNQNQMNKASVVEHDSQAVASVLCLDYVFKLAMTVYEYLP